MRTVYVAHAKKFPFKKELYEPIRSSALNETYEFIFPHEESDAPFSSKDFFERECDVLVVEASYSATGLGIEVGWADAYDVPIIIMYKSKHRISGSLVSMSKNIFSYTSLDEMIVLLGDGLKRVLSDEEF